MEREDELGGMPQVAEVGVADVRVARTAAGMRVTLTLEPAGGELPSCAIESWSVRNALGRTLVGAKGAFAFAGRGGREVCLEVPLEAGNPLFISDGSTVTLKILTDAGFKTRAFVECGPTGVQVSCEYLRSPMGEPEQAKFEALRRDALEEGARLDEAAAQKAARKAARMAARGAAQKPAEEAAHTVAQEAAAHKRERDRNSAEQVHAACPECGAQADIVLTRRGKKALSCPACKHYRILEF